MTAKQQYSMDDWAYGTEPIPGDHTWTKEKAPDGADG